MCTPDVSSSSLRSYKYLQALHPCAVTLASQRAKRTALTLSHKLGKVAPPCSANVGWLPIAAQPLLEDPTPPPEGEEADARPPSLAPRSAIKTAERSGACWSARSSSFCALSRCRPIHAAGTDRL